MEKEVKSRLNSLPIIFAVILCLALCPAVAFAAPLETASLSDASAGTVLQTNGSKNLKSYGVPFDLKQNKPVLYKRYMKGVGSLLYTATISNVQVESANPGYKTVSFTITHRLKKNPTAKQVKAIFQALRRYGNFDNMDSWSWNHFVDYTTGRSLEVPNNSFKAQWEKSYNNTKSTRIYRSHDGGWFSLNKEWTAKYSITCPEKYKGMCIGVGSCPVPRNSMSKADNNYIACKNPKCSYFQTSFFKKGLKNNHFIRIL